MVGIPCLVLAWEDEFMEHSSGKGAVTIGHREAAAGPTTAHLKQRGVWHVAGTESGQPEDWPRVRPQTRSRSKSLE
jgi:hypothetical protein